MLNYLSTGLKRNKLISLADSGSLDKFVNYFNSRNDVICRKIPFEKKKYDDANLIVLFVKVSGIVQKFKRNLKKKEGPTEI